MEKFLLIAGIIVLIIIAIGMVAWTEHKRRKAIGAFFAARGDTVWIKPTPQEKEAALAGVGNPLELKDGPAA